MPFVPSCNVVNVWKTGQYETFGLAIQWASLTKEGDFGKGGMSFLRLLGSLSGVTPFERHLRPHR